ncbi:MAG: hypothetical protein ACEY3L_13405, partial [Wolbachia sp.]
TLYGKGAKSFRQPFWHKFLFGFTFPARHFSYNALLLEDTSLFDESEKLLLIAEEIHNQDLMYL